MHTKDLSVAYLLDFYGEVLSDENREMLRLYYYEDLALSEIADSNGLTRQGVRAALKRSEQQLIFLENSLGLAESYKKAKAAVESIRAEIDSLADDKGCTDGLRDRLAGISVRLADLDDSL